jgi:hypothetical protein
MISKKYKCQIEYMLAVRGAGWKWDRKLYSNVNLTLITGKNYLGFVKKKKNFFKKIAFELLSYKI